MVKRVYIFSLFLLLITGIRAQVQVDVKLDSLQLFIGQQTDLTLSVTLDAKQKLVMPDIKKGQELIPDIEVVTVGKPDTAVLNDGKRMTVSQAWILSSRSVSQSREISAVRTAAVLPLRSLMGREKVVMSTSPPPVSI